jgi:cation-transporting ATPase E
VELTLFTVGLPTFFLTLWARPKPPQDDLLVDLARFVIPVGVLTAGFATAVYAYLYRQILDGFTGTPFPDAIRLFEHRIFTAWAPVSADRRPTWLALGLFGAFAVVLVVRATREYFGLTAPDPPVLGFPRIALVLWFGTLSLALRFRVLERILGLRVSG